jgi:hypothetical protein
MKRHSGDALAESIEAIGLIFAINLFDISYRE